MYTRTLRFGMLGLAAIGLFGCSQLDANAPQTVMGKAYSYPLDQTLALQHIQVRGTHNSYHIDTNEGRVEPWQYTHAPLYDQLDRLGIRQLELDVSYDAIDGLSVIHVPYVDTGTRCARFVDCLREIRRFSEAYPGHLPIFIQIEPKAGIPSDEILVAHKWARVFEITREAKPRKVFELLIQAPHPVGFAGWSVYRAERIATLMR